MDDEHVSEEQAKKVTDAMQGLGCMWLLGIIIALGLLGGVINGIGDLIRPDDASMTACIRSCGYQRCGSFEPPNTCRCEACDE